MNKALNYWRYSDYTVKWATTRWEHEQAYALRKRVFCDEQALFEHDDRDTTDDYATTLVALGNCGGWHHAVVGTVRISHEGDNVWQGSRLAVDPEFRREAQLGPALIKLAVSSAHALGCKQFKATVQSRNETLFKRLHWQTKDHKTLFGASHAIMEADLDAYPPFYTPQTGFVLRARRRPHYAEVWSGLIGNNAMPDSDPESRYRQAQGHKAVAS